LPHLEQFIEQRGPATPYNRKRPTGVVEVSLADLNCAKKEATPPKTNFATGAITRCLNFESSVFAKTLCVRRSIRFS
jgi:hypothetical protein